MKNKLILSILLINFIFGFFSNLLASDERESKYDSSSSTKMRKKNKPISNSESLEESDKIPTSYSTEDTDESVQDSYLRLTDGSEKSKSSRGDAETPKKLTLNASNTIPNSAPPKLLSLEVQRVPTTQPKKLNFQDQDIDDKPIKLALFRGIHYVTNLLSVNRVG